MPLIPFGQYRPDVSDYEGSSERDAQNVVPRGDGFGPFPSLQALTASLGAQCHGAINAVNTDGSVTIFAGTSTDLYKLNNTTLAWVKVSLSGGPYSALSAGENWEFVQFDTFIIAVQQNVAPQVWTLGSSSAFANLGGSPPQARYVSVVGRFVVLAGLQANPNRVQWSGLDDPNSSNAWTAGINSSDYQDLPDGGFVRGVAGGETGVILQDTCLRTMSYLAGSPIVFQIERIADQIGLFGAYSLVKSGTSILFYSAKGFQRIDPGSVPQPIGRERVDRTFAADLDAANLGLFIGMADPQSTRVLWAYKSINGSSNGFDKALCYDTALDKWTSLKFNGEWLTQIAQPGVTLENLDAIAPGALTITGAANNGSGLIRITVASTATLSTGQYKSISGVAGTTEANGNWFITVHNGTTFDLNGSTFTNAYSSGGIVGGSLDAMTQSLDIFSTTPIPQLAAFDTSHNLDFFRGANLEATLETAEQGTDGQRIKLKKGFRPITDAATLYGSASSRETQGASVTAGSESLINSTTGICNLLVDTRYSRFKVRIPAGTTWSFINGVEPLDLAATGKR